MNNTFSHTKTVNLEKEDLLFWVNYVLPKQYSWSSKVPPTLTLEQFTDDMAEEVFTAYSSHWYQVGNRLDEYDWEELIITEECCPYLFKYVDELLFGYS